MRADMRSMIALALVTLLTGAATAADLTDAAREHYERGLAKYNLADFDAAIDEFKQSYELSKAPRLLFNIAQAYRLKKDWERALYFYDTYLRNDPKAPNRPDVESRVDEMRKKLDEDAQAKPPPPVVKPPPPVVVAPPPPRGPSPRTLIATGIGLSGAGLVLAGVAGGLLGLASSDASTVSSIVNSGGMWSADAQHAWDEGTRSQTAAIALFAVGGAAIGAGLVVTIVGVRARRHQASTRASAD